MALTITPSQVLPNGAILDRGLPAAVTLAPGEVAYKDTTVSPNVWRLAQSNELATCSGTVGIVMSEAYAGQPTDVATGGPPIIGAGAAMTNDVMYCVSAGTAGGIDAQATVVGASGFVTVLGIGNSTSNAIVMPPNGVWVTGQ